MLPCLPSSEIMARGQGQIGQRTFAQRPRRVNRRGRTRTRDRTENQRCLRGEHTASFGEMSWDLGDEYDAGGYIFAPIVTSNSR